MKKEIFTEWYTQILTKHKLVTSPAPNLLKRMKSSNSYGITSTEKSLSHTNTHGYVPLFNSFDKKFKFTAN